VINTRGRRQARERALQFLFGLEFTGYEWELVIDDFWDGNPCRPGVQSYAERLIAGVADHQEELDAHIVSALENWSPERIGRIEWSMLRIALCEMLYHPDVPPAVAVNEAIEVVKRFGSNEAPRFVNGVLDRLLHALAAKEDGP